MLCSPSAPKLPSSAQLLGHLSAGERPSLQDDTDYSSSSSHLTFLIIEKIPWIVKVCLEYIIGEHCIFYAIIYAIFLFYWLFIFEYDFLRFLEKIYAVFGNIRDFSKIKYDYMFYFVLSYFK